MKKNDLLSVTHGVKSSGHVVVQASVQRSGPPVYRPQSAAPRAGVGATVQQMPGRTASSQSARMIYGSAQPQMSAQRSGPPVYRSQSSAGHFTAGPVVQPSMKRSAPPVYRPQPMGVNPIHGAAVQPSMKQRPDFPAYHSQLAAAKGNSGSVQQFSRRGGPPPAYRPQQAGVMLRKAASPQPPVGRSLQGSKTIQPMIALASKTGLDPMNDYAVLKVLHGVVQHEQTAGKPTAIVDLAAADFSSIPEDETLYIVGHGFSDDGNINDDRFDRAALTKKVEKIKKKIAGVVVLTCYSGQAYTDGAAIDVIAKALTIKDIPVTGMVGFSYGSPKTAETGKNSVLPSALREVYNGTDVEKLKTELSGLTIHTAAYSNIWGKYLQPGRTLGQQLSPKELDAGASLFMRCRDTNEASLKLLVANMGGTTVDLKVASLINSAFGDQVKSQYDLFTDAGLFATDETAYRTVRS